MLWWGTVLHSIVLYSTIIYCIVLYFTTHFYIILYCTVLYYNFLNYTVMSCTILYFTVIHFSVLYFNVLYCPVLHSTVLYFTVLYCTALDCSLVNHNTSYVLWPCLENYQAALKLDWVTLLMTDHPLTYSTTMHSRRYSLFAWSGQTAVTFEPIMLLQNPSGL